MLPGFRVSKAVNCCSLGPAYDQVTWPEQDCLHLKSQHIADIVWAMDVVGCFG